MVTAQQEISRTRARGGRRDEYYDHRSGRAAAAALSKARRPEPGSLVIGGRRLPWPCGAETSSSFSQRKAAAIGLSVRYLASHRPQRHHSKPLQRARGRRAVIQPQVRKLAAA